MRIGTQIVAPNGFRQLAKDVVYYFLKSDAANLRVLLVHFFVADRFEKSKATIIEIGRSLFEMATDKKLIIEVPVQSSLPPWLLDMEGIDLPRRDIARAGAKVLHATRIENRLLHLTPHVKNLNLILSAENPATEINRCALLCSPPQQETRFRLQFLSYVCFSCDPWALLPPFHRAGKWKRYDHPDVKFGAPSISFGSGYGHPSTEVMAEKCIASYIRYAKLGVSMTDIYTTMMDEVFKCKQLELDSGMMIYVHPKGEPFPTYWQFRYRVLQRFGVEEVQLTLYGRVRHRTRLAPSKGRFSEEIANLYEKVEADGYFTKERPRGYIEGSSLKPLCVVCSIDGLTGMKLGIGFSFGAERSTAYRMMLFSMSVPKAYFCMLFGIPYREGEWASEGLPPHFAVDRGPGARRTLIEEFEKRLPIREIAPSWSGQSKATIESSNPRKIKTEGQPTYFQSKLTPVQLAKKEIIRLLRYNHTTDVSDRMDPDGDLAFVPPTPAGLWSFYDKRGRNDAHPMSINEAVRTFLTPIELSLRDDGVWLEGRRFTSTQLEESGVLSKAARSNEPVPKVRGYMLDLCVRHVWVEIDDRLLLVDARLRTRNSDDLLWTSFEELRQWSEAMRKTKSRLSVHKLATTTKYKQVFKEATGMTWHSDVRRSGKAKRGATERQEEAEAKQHTSQRELA